MNCFCYSSPIRLHIGLGDTMQLKLARSQREGGVLSKSVIFCLDARVVLTPEERANVVRYRLGNEVIYNSKASERYLEAHQEALKTGTAGGVVRALGSLALVALNLNITVNGLVRGQHIECKDLNELLEAEEALMSACERLRVFLDAAVTFDGRELLIDFSTGKEPAVVQIAQAPMLAMAAPAIPSPAPLPVEPMVLAPQVPEHTPMTTASSVAAPLWNASVPLEANVLALWNRAPPEAKVLIGALGVLVLILLIRAVL